MNNISIFWGWKWGNM